MPNMTLTLRRLLVAASAAAFGPLAVAAGHLQPFADEQELARQFAVWAERLAQHASERRRHAPMAESAVAMQAAPAPAAKAAADESITNVQTAGVDEGGIVKRHGDHLVVLRRGRLFTVDIGGRRLAPVDAVDAFGPGIEPRGAWYDELLLWGDTVVVVGYSYARGGTEIGLFDLSADGRLHHRGTHHLRSNDYYSSRNYASRLVGSRLVFYTPLRIDPRRPYREQLPAQRTWRPGNEPAPFEPIAPPARIYQPSEPLDPLQGVALHSVTVCDLAQPRFACESTAVLGPAGRVFHVSAQSVYVWTTARHRTPAASQAVLYRLPLDGSAPSALRASGSPIDQFSFLEEDGRLHVLLRSHGRGEAMWGAEPHAGELALLRLPLASFGDGREAAPASAYRLLPGVAGASLHNRYVGGVLLYGASAGWRQRPTPARAQVLHAVRLGEGGDAPVYALPLDHAVERIEALGENAVVIGAQGRDLGFTSVRLARYPVTVGHHRRAGAAQGETRSHGFFYRAGGEGGGLVGLPVVGAGERAPHPRQQPPAEMLYLRESGLRFAELGTLAATPGGSRIDDGCRASCVDWYGNARPLFIGERVFALMGYEIVEGRLQGEPGAGERIREIGRIGFAPDHGWGARE